MLYLKALLPNPKGADTEGEYIILANDSSEAVSLLGWTIKDRSGKSAALEGIIEPGGQIYLSRALTKISLNNDGDAISLFDPTGTRRDELTYDWNVAEGELIERGAISPAALEPTEPTLQESVYYNATPTSFWGTISVIGLFLAVFGVWVIKYYIHDDIPSPK